MKDMWAKENLPQTLRFIVGSLIVIFGIVLLVDLFARFIDIEVLLQWWPGIFVLAGLAMVSSEKSNTLLGASLLLAGTTVLLARLGLFSDEVRQVFEIVALLFVGMAIAAPRSKKDS